MYVDLAFALHHEVVHSSASSAARDASSERGSSGASAPGGGSVSLLASPSTPAHTIAPNARYGQLDPSATRNSTLNCRSGSSGEVMNTGATRSAAPRSCAARLAWTGAQ